MHVHKFSLLGHKKSCAGSNFLIFGFFTTLDHVSEKRKMHRQIIYVYKVKNQTSCYKGIVFVQIKVGQNKSNKPKSLYTFLSSKVERLP